MTRRIERRLALNRSVDLDKYVDQLRNDPRELNSLYEDLLIGVTRFFRDDAAFAMLESRVIPELVERTAGDEQIRVWVAGCATGQEPYSIAMLLHEQLAAARRPINVKILATDVHKTSLEVASAGIYTEAAGGRHHARAAERFLHGQAQRLPDLPALRESIVFAPHNLIRDAPFTKLDLVTCRNLLIYFQPHAQKTVLSLFHFCLKPGGFLFLGSSETPGAMLDEFDTIDEHWKVYRKRRDIALPRDLKLPLARSAALTRAALAALPRSAASSRSCWPPTTACSIGSCRRAFSSTTDGNLVDSFGGVSPLLKVKERRPSQTLLDMLTDELKAWSRARSSAFAGIARGGPCTASPSRAMPDGFTLTAEPIRMRQGRDARADHVRGRRRGGAPRWLGPPRPADFTRRPPAPRPPAGAVAGMHVGGARGRAVLHEAEPRRRRSKSSRPPTRSCRRPTRS